MDKQIIIKRIRDCDNCKFRPETSKVCSDYENCYMVSEYIVNLGEQLRTKEQECEMLNNTVTNLENIRDKFSAKIDQLKAENRELKAVHSTNVALSDELFKYKAELRDMTIRKIDYLKESLKIKQTLTEIKKIALKSNMPPCLDIDCKCENCKDIVTNKGLNCMQYGLKQILQKISEVVDEK